MFISLSTMVASDQTRKLQSILLRLVACCHLTMYKAIFSTKHIDYWLLYLPFTITILVIFHFWTYKVTHPLWVFFAWLIPLIVFSIRAVNVSIDSTLPSGTRKIWMVLQIGISSFLCLSGILHFLMHWGFRILFSLQPKLPGHIFENIDRG